MAVDIESIKRLKELSGAGLTDAKKALEDAKGDFDKALKEMRAKGLTKAEKRSERETRAGTIGSYNHDNRIGVLVEINCETDFVARNEVFSNFVKDIAMQIAALNPEYISIDSVPKKIKVELNAEYTAKAKNDNKAADVIKKIVEGQVSKVLAEKCLLSQEFIKDSSITVENYLKETAAKLGENIIIRRFVRFELGETT